MKKYEVVTRTVLPPRTPIIIRVDGKAFHTFTRGAEKPFDAKLIEAMNQAALELCAQIQGAQFAYVQSDEISVFIHGYKTLASEPWFKGQALKMASISGAIASVVLTLESPKIFGKTKKALFDSRVFSLPEADLANYFIWRQNDWSRNSVQMLARSIFSQKKCHRKSITELQEMTYKAGRNWYDLENHLRLGRCILKKSLEIEPNVFRSKWVVDNVIPIFSQDRNYIEKHLLLEEE